MVKTDATALVALLPTDQGGRQGAMPEGWFGCVLTVAGRNHEVRLRLDHKLEPGTTRRIGLAFLDPGVAAEIGQGTTFGLWEGGEIGFGRIERVERTDSLAAE